MRISIENNRALMVLFAVLTISLCLNVALGWRVRILSAASTKSDMLSRHGSRGVMIPSVLALDPQGKTVLLPFPASSTTILYVLSPTCQWCFINESNVRVLAAALGTRVRFIGLSNTTVGLENYVSSRNLPFAVYGVAPHRVVSGLDLEVTPQMIVISPDGTIQKTWIGAFSGKRREEIEGYFKVSLPGVAGE